MVGQNLRTLKKQAVRKVVIREESSKIIVAGGFEPKCCVRNSGKAKPHGREVNTGNQRKKKEGGRKVNH